MDDAKSKLETFLGMYFNNEYYSDAVAGARANIAKQGPTADSWREIRGLIEARSLAVGEPLELVNHAANQVIDENTDDEAWRWLDLMVKNIERTDGVVDEY